MIYIDHVLILHRNDSLSWHQLAVQSSIFMSLLFSSSPLLQELKLWSDGAHERGFWGTSFLHSETDTSEHFPPAVSPSDFYTFYRNTASSIFLLLYVHYIDGWNSQRKNSQCFKISLNQSFPVSLPFKSTDLYVFSLILHIIGSFQEMGAVSVLKKKDFKANFIIMINTASDKEC